MAYNTSIEIKALVANYTSKEDFLIELKSKILTIKQMLDNSLVAGDLTSKNVTTEEVGSEFVHNISLVWVDQGAYDTRRATVGIQSEVDDLELSYTYTKVTD